MLKNGVLSLNPEYPKPAPLAGEALLRTRVAGVCGTDLALVAGYKGGYNGILGHEYVADVIAAPGNEGWIGARVVGEINSQCGDCDACSRGLETHCRNRRVLGIINWDGAMAEYFLSPVANLYRVPSSVGDEIAVFAEPVAAAYAVLRDLPQGEGERIVVYGDGRLGLLIAMVLDAEGHRPLLVGRHSEKLAFAAALGIKTTERASQNGEFDIAVDATGNPHALPDILASLRPRGTLIMKSTSSQPSTIDLSELVVNELRLVGSRCGPFRLAIASLAAGRVDPSPLIAAQYELSDAHAALNYASRADVLKVLIKGRLR